MMASVMKLLRCGRGPWFCVLTVALCCADFDGRGIATAAQNPPARRPVGRKGRATGRPSKTNPPKPRPAPVASPKVPNAKSQTPAQIAARRKVRLEAARQAARNARGGAPKPGGPAAGTGSRPASSRQPAAIRPRNPSSRPGAGPSTHIEIAPVDDNVPPEDRTYSFSFKNATYDQVISAFARQTGLGVLGDIPRDGKVDFVTTESWSFKEALARIRVLLFNYKALEPYWIDRTPTHLHVWRVNDMVRVLPLNRWYKSLDDLWAANLSDDELVLVLYTPKTGSASDLKRARDFLPDYVRMTPLNDNNSVSIFALVKDVRKFVDVLQWLPIGTYDTRPLVVIEINHILPSEALTKLEALMSSDPTQRARGSAPRRSGVKGANPLDLMQNPAMTILPIDSRSVLIVRAMQDRIDEIRKLLTVIDVEAGSEEFIPVVIPVENAKATDLMITIQQLMAMQSAAPGAAGRAAKPKTASRRRTTSSRSGTTKTPLRSAGVNLMVHPSQNAIIVLGDESAVAEVRELAKRFDVAGTVGPMRIPLDHAGAAEVATSIMSALGGTQKRGEPAKINLIADAKGDALWFTGSEYDLKKVRELVTVMDVALPGSTMHVVRLLHQQPTFVANLLAEYDRNPGSPKLRGSRPAKAAPRRSTASQAASKFTPNDVQGLLYVYCTDEEWTTYQALIEQLEDVAGGSENFVRIPVKHLDPQMAIDRLSTVVGGDPRNPTVKYIPTDGALLLVGAKPTEIANIKALLEQIDIPAPTEQRTFTIRHRPPEEVKAAIETLVGGMNSSGSSGARRGKRASAKAGGSISANLTIFEFGDKLIVRASPKTIEYVAELVANLDVAEAETIVRVYSDFAPGADLDVLADELVGALSDASDKAPSRSVARQPGVHTVGATGPKFIPQTAAGKLIVITPPAMIPKIEEMLVILRPSVNITPYVREFIPLKYADPEEIVELMTPLLEIRARQLVEAGELREPTKKSAAPAGASRRSKPGGATTSSHFHIAPDARNSWIVIAGPEVIIEDARVLAAKLDRPGAEEEGEFRTVILKNADPADMVKSIQGMMGSAGGRGQRRATAGKGGSSVPAPFDPQRLSVVEAPGGRSVILHGPAAVVDRTIDWIQQMDAQATRGRALKTYRIHNADIKTLAELILNVVDKPSPKTVRRVPRPTKSLGFELADEAEEFETTKTWTGAEMYIHADFIAGTMVVAAPAAMILEVDAIVAKFDPEEPTEGSGIVRTMMPQHTYALKYRTDVMGASSDLDMLLESVWQPSDELPKVEASSFGDILVIRYPDEERFAEVDALIQEYIDRPDKGADRIVRHPISVPEGLTPQQAVERFLSQQTGLAAKVINVTEPTPDYGIEQVRPRKATGGSNRCVLPAAFARFANGVVMGTALLQDPESGDDAGAATKPKDAPPPDEPEVVKEPVDVLRAASMQLLKAKKKENPEQEKKHREPEPAGVRPGTEVTIEIDDRNPREFVIEGRAGDLKDAPDWEEELSGEGDEKPFVPPDFRVYRVRYLDVYTAAEILEEMFNATRQQRQAAAQQARLQQQQARNAAAQQARLQQQQARQNKNQSGKGQKPNQQQPQAQAAAAQLPPTTVRIYPNPRDKTLILRADASQYPAILELLATIDQPRPLNSEIRTYKLDKLNAVEVEQMLREMLGLDKRASSARSSARGRGAAGGASARRASGGQLPETLTQDVISGTGKLGIDTEDIKLSSNEQANTLIALAPRAALDYIGDLIKQLEGDDVPDRVTKYYELKNADAGEVAEYLDMQFAERAPPGQGGKSKGRRSAGTAGRSLNTPSFVPYPPRNILTVLATPQQIEEVDEIVARLDVKDADEWRNVTLAHANAQAVADTLTQMYGSGAGPARASRGRGRATARSGPGAKFLADDSGRLVFYSVADGLLQPVQDTIAKLEAEAADTAKLRVVKLKYAKASDVAEAIDEAYGKSRRGRSRGKAPSTVQLSVSAHDATGKLFVRADDETFEEIVSLAEQLDQPKTIGVAFRIYPLQYANARQVHSIMTKMMTEYFQRVGRRGQAGGMDAFSVDVDERANALIVLGTPSVFQFVEENLRRVDTPASEAGQPGFLMIALKNADAKEVAGNITRLWTKKTSSGEQPPRVEANRSLNTLIVRGTQAQIDEIRREVIDPLEQQTAKTLLTEIITLKHAEADAVADSINRIFEDKKRAMQNVRTSGGSALDFTVVVTPDPITKQIIVQASQENMLLVKARVAELDREDIARAGAMRVKIYSMKYADPTAVAKIISAWGRTRVSGGGRPGSASDAVTAIAEPATRSIVVTATETNQLIIADLLDELDGETGANRRRQRAVLKLKVADATEVSEQLGRIFRQGGSRRGGDTGPTFVASPDTNAIVVTVYEDELAEVRKLLSQLDIAGEVATDRVTEIYPLQHALPSALPQMLDGIFRVDRGQAQRPSDVVTAEVQEGTQSLIVTASPRNHVLVKALIDKIDVASRYQRDYHTVTLQKGDVQIVAPSLQKLFRGRRGSPSGEKPPQITADPGTNSLLVYASEVEMEDIDRLVAMLDVDPDLSRGRQIKSVRLVNADPGVVQDAITKVFGDDRSDVAGPVTAVAEWGSNSVIVSATPFNMKRVDGLIKEIDGAGGEAHTVHVVTLTNADADPVSRTLKEIFVRGGRRGATGGDQPITISALQGSKALLIRARDEDFAKIEATVAELDREDAVVGGEVRVISLLYSDAAELQTALEKYLSKAGGTGRGKRAGELAGNVRISALSQNNALVISGVKEDVDRLEGTIKMLDDAGKKGNAPEVISLKHAYATDLAPNLTEMFIMAPGSGARDKIPPVIIANEIGNSLIVRGSATDLAAIHGLVDQLDTEDRVPENFRLVRLASGTNVFRVADKVERTLNDSAAARQSQGSGRGFGFQSISITPDARSNALILAGSPSMFDDAVKLARAMEEAGPGGNRTVRMIKLGMVPADEIRQLIDRLKGEPDSLRSSNGRRGGSINRSRSRSGRSRSRSGSARSRSRSRSGSNRSRSGVRSNRSRSRSNPARSRSRSGSRGRRP